VAQGERIVLEYAPRGDRRWEGVYLHDHDETSCSRESLEPRERLQTPAQLPEAVFGVSELQDVADRSRQGHWGDEEDREEQRVLRESAGHGWAARQLDPSAPGLFRMPRPFRARLAPAGDGSWVARRPGARRSCDLAFPGLVVRTLSWASPARRPRLHPEDVRRRQPARRLPQCPVLL